MYDLYPEWGPAARDADHPHAPSARRAHQRWLAAPAGAPDPRDAAADRPDDN